MSYDGNGTYNLPTPAYPAIPNTTITAEDFNEIMDDLKAALSSVLVRDGQSAMTGDLNMGNHTLTNLGGLAGPVAGMVLTLINSIAGHATNGLTMTNVTSVSALGGNLTITGNIAQTGNLAVSGNLSVGGTVALPAGTTGTTAAPGTNNTILATTAYVLAAIASQVMAATFPGQAGNAGKMPITDGSNVAWSGDLKSSVVTFVDATDPTKKLAFNVSGVTAGQTRTVTVPDKSGTLAMIGDVTTDTLAEDLFAYSLYF